MAVISCQEKKQSILEFLQNNYLLHQNAFFFEHMLMGQ